MKIDFIKNGNDAGKSGITLVEVIIYTTLLSFLMAGFIQYAYFIHENNIQLIHEIQDN